ncbi:MAG: hypothetical protein CMF48_03360 [Legionellales bacterium]|nr:hypothetical protein [Legionellales bacterium]
MKLLLQTSIITALLSLTQAANAEGEHQHGKGDAMSGMHAQMMGKMHDMEHGEDCMGKCTKT